MCFKVLGNTLGVTCITVNRVCNDNCLQCFSVSLFPYLCFIEFYLLVVNCMSQVESV